jgi:glycosyltransferase involved in cell wall biosynthesis
LYRTVVARIRRWLDRAAIHLSDAVNTICRRAAEDLLGARAASATVILNGVSDAAETDLGRCRCPERCELLYVGAPGPRKRVLALPFVLERVRRTHPQARLRIVGLAPDSEPVLLHLLTELELLSHVDLVGVKPSTELTYFYRSSDVLLVPSAYEGLPYVILEALRAGLPPVATRVGGHPEVICDGSNGFLVDLDRPDQMAARCCQILGDPELRRRLGEGARTSVSERFSLKRTVDDYLSLYRRLLEAKET